VCSISAFSRSPSSLTTVLGATSDASDASGASGASGAAAAASGGGAAAYANASTVEDRLLSVESQALVHTVYFHPTDSLH
jgi:hypothetical protein